ncbi:DMT family transporter [Histophilus somni]|uniref:DMT family transporter n=1 Tax=Histophilus somni TaxID=731 RepID=A0A9Q7E7L4_HISSO|nr:DMT family transporter [Histophilus somni]ACA30923.1 protein of unknown function DUF6 transmembrane [Histophilus somni 2336]ARU64248.1 EamA family transporter [Histophilus somni]ARU66032.1 EamA family transporter [Histophilus somni]ARU67905.1 EamA family transporter [Histophilus somni]ARU69785.1 EamA family transporter [Histophilus somni]
MKQKPLLGFIFALTTAIAWGSLPIALQQVMNAMSMQTIVWFRFMVATVALAILLKLANRLPKLSDLNRYFFGLVILGVIGLSGNFSLFNSSLKFIEPSVTQIFVHFSSFAMMFCGVVIFKERLGLHQKIGLVILIIGLILFFNERADQLFDINIYSIGVFLSMSASLIWVTYGLAQKLLLRRFNSQQILLMIYTGCAFVFTPFVEIEQLQNLNTFTLICFIYCCLNTLIGYGAYAEALNHWDVAKVSVVITLVPLFTILFAHLLNLIYPQYFSAPELNTLSYIGAFIVVFGAMTSAIGYKFIKNKI